MNPATLATLEANYQAPTATQTASKAGTVKSKGILGFLERNAPTIGGVLGGIVAAPLDPVTGGAASIAAAGAGASIGQGVKNEASGEGLTNDLVGAGIGGATGQFGGRILGKVLGGTVGKAFTKGTSAVVDHAADKAAQDELVQNTLPFQGVSKNIRNANDLNGTLNHLTGLGVTPSVANMHAASGLVTGTDGVLSGTTRQLLGNVGEVSTDGIMDTANEALKREAGQGIGDVGKRGTAANNILGSIRQTVENIGNKGEGSITGTADANNLLDTVQTMEDRIRDLGGVQAAGSNGAEARVLQSTKQSIMSKLSAATDQNVKDFKFAPEDEQAIHDAAAKAGLPPTLADHVINTGNNAKSLQELRAAQAPFVRGSKLAQAADEAAGGALPQVEAGATPGSDVINLGANIATGNHFGLARSLSKAVGDVTTSQPVVKTAEVAGKGAGLLNRVLPGGTANDLTQLATQSAAQHNQSTTANATDNAPAPFPTAAATLPGATSGTDGAASTSPDGGVVYTEQELINDINNDPKNASNYISLFKTLQPSNTTSAADQATVSSLKDASSYVDTAEQELAALGGSKGPVSGKEADIPLVGQYLQPGAAAYNKTKVDVATAIAKALTGSKPAATIVKAYMESLPSVTDTPDVAAQKIANIRLELNNKLADYGGAQ